MGKTISMAIPKSFWKKFKEKEQKENVKLHPTFIEDIRGYIDYYDYISSEKQIINGWVLDEIDGEVEEVRIAGDHELFFSAFDIPRPDVQEVYEGKIPQAIGFQLEFKVSANIPFINLEIKRKGSDTYEVWNKVSLLDKRVEIDSTLSKVNDNVPSLVVVDDFYENPEEIRKIALSKEYHPSEYHKGKRTKDRLLLEGTKEKIEKLLGKRIVGWSQRYGYNGCFQSCIPADPIVYHHDVQTHAAMVFLTPDAPPECGTSFFRHKEQKWVDKKLEIGMGPLKTENDVNQAEAKYVGSKHDDFLDATKWELIDKIGNKFNRLVIFDAQRIHSASQYFGTDVETSRLFHMLFFDVQK